MYTGKVFMASHVYPMHLDNYSWYVLTSIFTIYESVHVRTICILCHQGTTDKASLHEEKPDKEVQSTQLPLNEPQFKELPTAEQSSELQQESLAMSMDVFFNDRKDEISLNSTDNELNASKKPNPNQFEESKIYNRNVKGSPACESPFICKRSSSYSISSMTNSSPSRTPDNELQQILKRRLDKESDPNALEKFESTVKANMSQSKAFAGGMKKVPVS